MLFYSTSAVAKLFKVNRVTIYRWVKEGKIKAYGIGKHLKIPLSEVGRLLHEFGFSPLDIHTMYEDAQDGQALESARYLEANLNGKRLVIAVDDNEDILGFIEEMFQRTDLGESCTLLTFSDSLDAALQIGGEKPDLVLLDVKMSGLDGIDLAVKIKSIYEDVKIVFMSGYPDEETERIKDLKVFEYLVKPIDFDTLYAVIHSALKQ